MKFTLDLIFVDKSFSVVRLVRGLGPNRIVSGGPYAYAVFEMEAGWMSPDQLHLGDVISLQAAD